MLSKYPKPWAPLPPRRGSSRLTTATSTTRAGRLHAEREHFLAEEDWKQIVAFLALSPWESEVAKLLLTGTNERDVGAELSISAHTVHTHVERLYRKLAIGSRCELIARLFAAYVVLHSGDKRLGA